MKQTIRLNERELHRMISESVKRVINEASFAMGDDGIGYYGADEIEHKEIDNITVEEGNYPNEYVLKWDNKIIGGVELRPTYITSSPRGKYMEFSDKNKLNNYLEKLRSKGITPEQLATIYYNANWDD